MHTPHDEDLSHEDREHLIEGLRLTIDIQAEALRRLTNEVAIKQTALTNLRGSLESACTERDIAHAALVMTHKIAET